MSTVMVVDDTDVHRETLARLIRRAGYNTVTAEDGNKALHMLRDEHQKPDLIVLDVMLPSIDGLDLLEMLHDNPQWRSLPVVMLTGCSDTHCIQRAMRLGAKRYMIKAAFSVGELLECVREYAGPGQ